jgi:tRNA threonylcarbamoyladenosine biosynthesis protein TsaE
MKEWVFDEAGIPAVALAFCDYMKVNRVIAFHGQMGAGKTTFIHAICDVKKVSSTVSSPTFSIINEYNCPEGSLFHIDLYRLKTEEEAIRAGVEDALYSGSLCLVEWPERIPHLFPEDTQHVFLDLLEDGKRSIRVADK